MQYWPRLQSIDVSIYLSSLDYPKFYTFKKPGVMYFDKFYVDKF